MKAPGTKRLKLQYDEPPSNFAFKFNLRRYNKAGAATAAKAYRVIGDELFREERYPEVRPGVYHSALLVQRQ